MVWLHPSRSGGSPSGSFDGNTSGYSLSNAGRSVVVSFAMAEDIAIQVRGSCIAHVRVYPSFWKCAVEFAVSRVTAFSCRKGIPSMTSYPAMDTIKNDVLDLWPSPISTDAIASVFAIVFDPFAAILIVIGCFNVLVGMLFVCTQLLDIRLRPVVPVSSRTLAYAPLILSVVIMVFVGVLVAAVATISSVDIWAKNSSTVGGSGDCDIPALADWTFLR